MLFLPPPNASHRFPFPEKHTHRFYASLKMLLVNRGPFRALGIADDIEPARPFLAVIYRTLADELLPSVPSTPHSVSPPQERSVDDHLGDPLSSQQGLEAVGVSGLLGLDRSHLAVEMSGVFVLGVGNANHPASQPIARLKTHQRDDDLLCVDAIGLRTAFLSVHFDRGRFNNVTFHAHGDQTPMHPESIATGFVATDDGAIGIQLESLPSSFDLCSKILEVARIHRADSRPPAEAIGKAEAPVRCMARSAIGAGAFQ